MAKSSFRKPAPRGEKPAGKGAAPAKKAPPGAPAKKTPAAPVAKAPPPKRLPARPPPGIRSNAPAAAEPEPPEDMATPPPAEDRRVTTRPTQEPALNMMTVPVGQPVGDFDANDFDIPMLKIAQGSDSPLINDLGFSDGDIVVNSETILWQEGCAPIEITILRWQKQFMQQMDYGSDEMGQIFNTSQEAKDAGLVPFGGHEVGYVSFINAHVLIKQGEGIEGSIFTEEFKGELYGLALWRITGTAYKSAAKKINGKMRTTLRDGLHTGSLLLEAHQERGRVGLYWVPTVKDGEMHDKKFIEFAVKVAGGEES